MASKTQVSGIGYVMLSGAEPRPMKELNEIIKSAKKGIQRPAFFYDYFHRNVYIHEKLFIRDKTLRSLSLARARAPNAFGFVVFMFK